MNDVTLRMLDMLRAASCPDGVPPMHALEAFMCLLNGATSGLGTTDRLCVELAATSDGPRAEPFAMLYRASSDRDGARSGGRPWALAIEGLLTLPKPERAALALSCVAGFGEGEVAAVLGVPAEQARATIEAGVRAIRARAREGRPRGRPGRAA